MLSYSTLTSLSDALKAYRASGAIIFDTRDYGNYSEHRWDDTVAMLTKADPTGLAMGLLLDEMFEATINGASVKLSRLLREDGSLKLWCLSHPPISGNEST